MTTNCISQSPSYNNSFNGMQDLEEDQCWKTAAFYNSWMFNTLPEVRRSNVSATNPVQAHVMSPLTVAKYKHPSVKKLLQKNQNVILPQEVNKCHLDPVIVLDESEVSDWYNHQLNALKQKFPNITITHIPTKYSEAKVRKPVSKPKSVSIKRKAARRVCNVPNKKIFNESQVACITRKSARLASYKNKKEQPKEMKCDEETFPNDKLGQKLLFTSYLGLTPFVPRNSKDKYENVLLVDNMIKTFVYKRCHLACPSKSELYNHEKSHFCCKLCDKYFNSHLLLRLHLLSECSALNEDEDVICISDDEESCCNN